MFVYPLTRQIYPAAKEVKCDVSYKYAYQLYIDNDNLLYRLMPAPVPLQPPNIFTKLCRFNSQNYLIRITTCRYLYTKSIKSFLRQHFTFRWIKNCLDKSFKGNFNGKTNTQNDFLAYAIGINRQIYLDSLLSPQFFPNWFKRTFGTITFYVETIGMYFACFLCLNLITDIEVALIRAFEIHFISNKTLGFWKIMPHKKFIKQPNPKFDFFNLDNILEKF